jgi:hypothetical protein
VLAATNEYEINIGGKTVSQRALLEAAGGDDDWDIMDATELERIFPSECIDDDTEGDHATLWREDILRRLRSGKPVVKPEGLDVGSPKVPFRFPDRDISIDNIFKLSDPSRVSLAIGEHRIGRYDFQSETNAFRVSNFVLKGVSNPWRKVNFEHNTNVAVELSVDLKWEKRSFRQLLTGRRVASHWELTQRMRSSESGEHNWQTIDENTPAMIKTMRDQAWNTLLDAASTFDYARNLVPPDDVRAMLTLPIAEPYDNFYTDNVGFWTRDLFVGFRQDGFVNDGEREAGLVRVSREARGRNGKTVLEHYFFILQRQADGSECVVIEYMPDQDKEGQRYELSYLGGRKLDVAHRVT